MGSDFQLSDWIHGDLLSDDSNVKQNASPTRILGNVGTIGEPDDLGPIEGPSSSTTLRDTCEAPSDSHSDFSPTSMNSHSIPPSLLSDVAMDDVGSIPGDTERDSLTQDHYPPSGGNYPSTSITNCGTDSTPSTERVSPREFPVGTKPLKPTRRRGPRGTFSKTKLDPGIPWLVHENGFQSFLEMCFPKESRVGPHFPVQRSYTCPACGNNFASPQDLVRHVTATHLVVAARRHIISRGLAANLPDNWEDYSEAGDENDEIMLLHFTVFAQRRDPEAVFDSVEVDSQAFLAKYDKCFYDLPSLEAGGELDSLRARLAEYCLLWAQEFSCTMCHTWWSRHDSLLRHRRLIHADYEALVPLLSSGSAFSVKFPPKARCQG
ncbi:hypothetical protein BS47DRAFT_1395324 [Hydnum rufescens UP504]|uniref:C2H2-type domain-containing protein n=1 Tax=Hydnum rufescens UP504 TaxID=1448309 RepID=A0A9P6DU21_9AGAM|nr:hypothetical protein BS47DRAFT_1395324 [Hydnum rufescens UP504]